MSAQVQMHAVSLASSETLLGLGVREFLGMSTWRRMGLCNCPQLGYSPPIVGATHRSPFREL